MTCPIKAPALLLALILAATPLPSYGIGSISISAQGQSYTENFDTLAYSYTSDILPNGWDFVEQGTFANTTYTPGVGNNNTGDTYSFGSQYQIDRALGTLLSSNNSTIIGASFTNNTGSTITAITITYTGELWRLGTPNRVDRLDFEYSTTATSLTDGTWIAVDGLDFSTPDTSGTTGARDGNAAQYRTTLLATISGLSIANGATFRIRWLDFNATTADDGLAIDDFFLLAGQEASILSVGFAGLGGNKIESTVPDGRINCLKGSLSGCSNLFERVGSITLNATADWQSTFAGWSGDITSSDNPIIFTLDSNKTITATFDPLYKAKAESTNALYSSLQNACDSEASGATILAQDYFFMEPSGLTIGRFMAKIVSIKGGLDADYLTCPSPTSMTVVQGPLKVINGKLTANRLAVRE